MRLLKHALLVLVVSLSQAATQAQAQSETLDLGGVVRLMRSGVSDEAIVLAIRNAKTTKFDTSVDGLISLKQAGLSDSMIAAIVERSGSRPQGNSVTITLPGEVAVKPMAAIQDGRTIALVPVTIMSMFAKSKKGEDAMASLQTLGVGIQMGATVAAGAAGAAGSMAGGIGIPVLGAAARLWGMNKIRRLPGFEYELLPDIQAKAVLRPAPTEFVVPLAAFNDGRYARAEPVLLRAAISKDTQMRVIGTAKAEMKYSDMKGPQSPEKLEPFRREAVAAKCTKTADVATVRAESLPNGEYIIGFLLDGKLLPQALDFTVR